jgi:hypothetical protein
VQNNSRIPEANLMSRSLILAVIFVHVSSALAQAQFKDTAPRAESPKLWQASAAMVDGKVLIQLARPVEQGTPDGVRRADGVVMQPSGTVWNWVDFPKKMTLCKNVIAFHADGKVVEPDVVVKALAKPTGVAVFVRPNVSKETRPEAFYLHLLREDTIVLVAEQKDIYPTEP